jgi:hypothetical protein
VAVRSTCQFKVDFPISDLNFQNQQTSGPTKFEARDGPKTTIHPDIGGGLVRFRILAVDDESLALETTMHLLASEPDVEVRTASSFDEAIGWCALNPTRSRSCCWISQCPKWTGQHRSRFSEFQDSRG